MNRVLFTGFKPFGAHAFNPSAVVAETAAEHAGAAYELLDVDFEAALLAGQAARDWDVVVHVGLAAATSWVRLEQFAHNLRMVEPDPGQEEDPDDICELSSGPVALRTTFPIAELRRTLASDWDVRYSRDAGTFVCNATYFWSLSHAPDSSVVFVHVPIWDIAEAERFGTALGNATDRLVGSAR